MGKKHNNRITNAGIFFLILGSKITYNIDNITTTATLLLDVSDLIVIFLSL